MDFITCFLNSEGGGSIIVVVDRFSKYGTFIAAPPDVTADDTAKLFFKNVIIRMDLNFSMSFHPQMDGQTKRVNVLLELYLQHYLSANQHDWAKLLDVSKFSYNMQRSEATGKSPFELAAKKKNKWADKKRRHVEFEVRDQVMVKLLPQQFKSLRKVHKGLIRSFLKPYHGDEEDSEQGVSKRAPTTVVTLYDQEVEEILLDRMIKDEECRAIKNEIKRYHEDDTTRTSRA
ncbi:putative nucleotidyltransferase, ribonuclease H [Tanacetum coccineum]